MTTKAYTIKNYRVGSKTFTVEAFAFPESNEIDYEVWTPEGEYLFTITSNRPDLSTSVLWAYIKGLPTPAVVYSTEESNV